MFDQYIILMKLSELDTQQTKEDGLEITHILFMTSLNKTRTILWRYKIQQMSQIYEWLLGLGR